MDASGKFFGSVRLHEASMKFQTSTKNIEPLDQNVFETLSFQ